MEEDIKKLLEIVVKRYIEEYIINLDLSDSIKNMLKRQLRKTILDEDLLYDLETTVYKNSILKSLVKEKMKEIKSKGICKNTDFCNNSCFYYSTCNVLQDLLERSREDG